MSYATSTSVPVEKTRGEIERSLQRYGASAFMSGWTDEKAYVGFEIAHRRVKFVLSLPKKEDKQFWVDKRTSYRTVPESKARERWEQACRSRWRALLLCIKAKLESVESGIESFEDAFMPHIVLPDGRTVGEHVRPGIAAAYESGDVPKLLSAGEVTQ